ncbi:MAG: DUF1838 domain-containing protein [Deltaproteobacteria bacterium]|nr:DUF1838 domain-containing protein [Deltaproteobacteria bacterium]
MRTAVLAIPLAALACRVAAPAPPSATLAITTDELVRLRCATDGRDTYTTWRGTVYAFVPDEPPRALFATVGMNVARCLRDGDGWELVSRELMAYLDPETGAILDRWANPWTGATVPVVHVANRIVQNPLAGGAPLQLAGGWATATIDVPLFYPNPLATDDASRAYSPAASYQAGEFFALSAPAEALVDPARATVPAMTLAWHRVGPWLPWMAMGDRPGLLVYVAHGARVDGFEALPAILRDEISARVPLYRHAPRCIVRDRNETSWTYFARHRAEYEAGARFPIAEPDAPDACR